MLIFAFVLYGKYFIQNPARAILQQLLWMLDFPVFDIIILIGIHMDDLI